MKELHLPLNIDLITMQCKPDDNFEIYSYMDFNRKKIEVFVNDEVPIKINVDKIAKKRLNIKNFWNEVQDVKFKVDFAKDELIVIYYIKD